MSRNPSTVQIQKDCGRLIDNYYALLSVLFLKQINRATDSHQTERDAQKNDSFMLGPANIFLMV